MKEKSMLIYPFHNLDVVPLYLICGSTNTGNNDHGKNYLKKFTNDRRIDSAHYDFPSKLPHHLLYHNYFSSILQKCELAWKKHEAELAPCQHWHRVGGNEVND